MMVTQHIRVRSQPMSRRITTQRSCSLLAATVLLVFILVGCSGDEPAAPTDAPAADTPTAAPAPSPTADAPPPPSATGQSSGGGRRPAAAPRPAPGPSAAMSSGASAPAAPAEGVVLHFSVKGMHCRDCVNTITQAVSAMDGVLACSVSLEEESATITVTDALLTGAIVEKIGSLQYTATLIEG
jgi:copper chaperone CopZ